jgi:hypothetical protein
LPPLPASAASGCQQQSLLRARRPDLSNRIVQNDRGRRLSRKAVRSHPKPRILRVGLGNQLKDATNGRHAMRSSNVFASTPLCVGRLSRL